MGSGSGKNDEIVNKQGVYAELTVGTTAVAVRVGGSNLEDRQLITMRAKRNSVYWGYDSSVTTTTGTRLFKDELVIMPIGEEIDVYLIANGNNRDVSIGELA